MAYSFNTRSFSNIVIRLIICSLPAHVFTPKPLKGAQEVYHIHDSRLITVSQLFCFDFAAGSGEHQRIPTPA